MFSATKLIAVKTLNVMNYKALMQIIKANTYAMPLSKIVQKETTLCLFLVYRKNPNVVNVDAWIDGEHLDV